MTSMTQPRRAARFLQARTAQPYQRLLALAEAACSDGDDDATIAQRSELYSLALTTAVPDAVDDSAALLALVWPNVDLAEVEGQHRRQVLDAAAAVLRSAAVGGVGRTVRNGFTFYDAAPHSPELGELVAAATALELLDDREPGGPLGEIVAVWHAGAVPDSSLVELADAWWHSFGSLACDRLLAAAGLHPSAWVDDED
jgi:hypothetical protein